MSITKIHLWKRHGVYYVGYLDEAGKRRWKSTGCTVKSEALQSLSHFENLLKPRIQPKRRSEFTAEFLSYANSVYAKSTVDIFAIGLKHLSEIAGNSPLQGLSLKHLDLYKILRLKSVTPTSVNVELRALRTIMNIALRWNLLEKNPLANLQLLRIPEKPPSCLSPNDFLKLLGKIKEPWLKELVTFSVLTGLRRGELLNLKWDQVDFEKRVLHIQSSVSFTTKHGRIRTIPLNDVAYRCLLCKKERTRSGYVFTIGDRRIEGSHFSHKFKEAVRLAALDENLHVHSLRHTHATWLVRAGVNIYEVQKLLGHRNVTTTEVYSHLASSELHRAVNTLRLPMS